MKKTKLMAVINATPDSFVEQSRVSTIDQAVARAITFQQEGADILDIGGESSRPGAAPVSEAEELQRVVPLIQAIKSQISIPISIDTVKPAVAKAAAKAGASLLNDITGFANPLMVDIAAEFNMDLCVMHMDGTPQTMQANPSYPEGISNYLMSWFEAKIDALLRSGIKKEKIILDPGIGFGKTVADNLEIIHNLPRFKGLGYPLLIGTSRKSFLSKILNKKPTELLAATLAIDTIAIAAGVDIVRVHDVKEHRDAIDVISAYLAQ